MRNKKPCKEQVGIEIDAKVVEEWRIRWPGLCEIVHGDALTKLGALELTKDTLVYSDPPYLPETRRKARLYRHEYSIADHVHLLEALSNVACKVMISGYDSPLYRRLLATWNVHKFSASTHNGSREETVWFNFTRPLTVHDDRYLGDTFRQREAIRRRQARLRKRLLKLPPAELASLSNWLVSTSNQG